MKIPRRRFLHLAAGATALPFLPRAAGAENQPPTSFELRERPLAERLAAYASGLRYDDLGAATIERVKTLVIDTIGCGFGAWDERSVRTCREIALSVETRGAEHSDRLVSALRQAGYTVEFAPGRLS